MAAPSIIRKKAGKKQLAVLLDPDKLREEDVVAIVNEAVVSSVDYFFVGGSLLMTYQIDALIKMIKSLCDIPVILFPGNSLQISKYADGVLLLSLISGRNPDLLIGQHVTAAPILKKAQLEILPTGYMLIDGGKATTASYISNTQPIPSDKPEVAACTALAGEMLGLRYMYLDAGSGAEQVVSAAMIKAVKEHVSTPLLVGGGINTPEKAGQACEAGADVVVVGNAIEKDISLIRKISQYINAVNDEANMVLATGSKIEHPPKS